MGERSNVVRFPGTEDMEETRRKSDRQIKRHRYLRFYSILLIVFLIAGCLIGYLIYEKTRVFESAECVSFVSRENIDGTRMLPLGESVLTYSKDGANAVDGTGKLLWNQTFDMQSPMAATCGGTAAFADYGGNMIFIQTVKNESAVVNTDKPIRKITVSENGYVAAVLDDVDVTWIYMYDINGTVISYFRITMEKSGYPVDINLSTNGELLAVSYYFVDCGDIHSSVAFYNFGDVGQNSIDNLVSSYNYTDSLVPFVQFVDKETAFAVSEERLSIYAGAHKPVNISDMFVTDEVLSVFYGSDAVGIIYNNAANGTEYRLEVYDKSGKVLSKKEFDHDYSNVILKNGYVTLYGETSLYVGTYAGVSKFDGTYKKPMLLVVPGLTAEKLTIVTADSVDSVELR